MVMGTIIIRKGKEYFTRSVIHSGDKYVYARRVIKTGLAKGVVRVWLKGSRLKMGEIIPKKGNKPT